jgi:hypothetical protein
MEFMFFKEWYVYNKINNQNSIDQGLDNLIPLNHISDSLKTFWWDHFTKLPSNEQKIIKLNYHNHIKTQI